MVDEHCAMEHSFRITTVNGDFNISLEQTLLGEDKCIVAEFSVNINIGIIAESAQTLKVHENKTIVANESDFQPLA